MCILVVEDEDLIRLIVVEELIDRGFEVCEAETGDQAAGIIAAAESVITLLITDVHMPGMLDGFAVANLVRTHYPDAPIIFTTGRPDIAHGAVRLRDRDALMSKPFVPSQLIATVLQLLPHPEQGSPST